jgi:hypothetical protein
MDSDVAEERNCNANTIEGYFSIFKRGMKGVYQHCAEKHLHRYLAEFDFRYNYRASLGFNDTDRTIAAVRGGEGKRLTYHQPPLSRIFDFRRRGSCVGCGAAAVEAFCGPICGTRHRELEYPLAV